ncbi:26S proteasome non-ATPase regulatory subunit 5 [Linnemannia zychae]|nr:26S proteasome non-ATPase regulatory subunit 5 [Linnemannia zychae]
MPEPTRHEGATANGGSGATQLDQILGSFTTLTNPLDINEALLVIEYSLKDPNTTAQTSQKILSSIPLSYFFQILQQDFGFDTEQTVNITCNVLELLLKDQPYSSIVQDEFLFAALGQALNSPSPRVRALGLAQVDKVSEEDISVLHAFLDSPILKVVFSGIGSDSIAIAERSKKTFLKICDTMERLQAVIDHEESYNVIRELAHSRNSIVQLRMMEVLTQLASQSISATKLLEMTHLLDPLKAGLCSTDTLTRFNILEILAEFGTTFSGSEFLDQSGTLESIAHVVENEAGQDPLSMSAIAKLYGKLGASEKVDFVTLDMEHQILDQLKKLLVGDGDYVPDESVKVEAMSAIGLIGGNVENVEWVTQSECAESFINILQSLSRDTKVAWYHSLAQILACSPHPTYDTENAVSQFFTRLDGDPTRQSPFISRLLATAKSQSQELSLSALSAMIPLAHYSFGVQKMAAQRDVMTFLLERNAEQTHSEKVAKHDVVVAMLNTAEAKRMNGTELLTPDQVSRLDLYRRQGPFYQRATATVAIQDIAA